MSRIRDLFSPPTVKWFETAFGMPTKVQEETWPEILEGESVLVSAPTGTGKTLSAFLIFIDRLKAMAREGTLEDRLYMIYVSPLKSLAGDIRENLKRPLEGIGEAEKEMYGASGEIRAAIRTGDTPQQERQKMIRRPPHILIITPESLYLMLTGKSSRSVLYRAQAIIIDELHAMIDTKRGAHLMLSIARLDHLCGKPVQRIGLSATLEPLSLAAEYLSPEPAKIIAPLMEKQVHIEIRGTLPRIGRRKDPVWEELAREVYKQCQGSRSVIAFSEGRRYAEKIAYYVNQLGGEGFARVHHGSLSKEQRLETEKALREGSLRLLCATSSMELGIDVGEIDQVLQIGCPRTISSTMQRLGRAGHNPGRTSSMYMYPRTAPEGLFCAMTAEIARRGGVEKAAPPRRCLDVLAQHLVSMATMEYRVDEVMEILQRTYSFREVTKQEVKDVLGMLAGDYEHSREIPVRPRLLYDRIHERVSGDAYSRMLAVAAGGTIPDKGLYLAKTEDNVRLGELDEEFVYEIRIGDKIVLGSFAWRVTRLEKDAVIMAPADGDGARLPFWKGEIKGRSLATSLEFGKIMRRLAGGREAGTLLEDLAALGMNESAAESAADFLERQIVSTGILPDDQTIIAEHFTDHTGCHQIMVHALYGKRVNAPLCMLAQYAAEKASGVNVGSVEEEDGFLLYPYGEERLPEGLLFAISPQTARQILEAMLPVTPVFHMTFRYNAARALMMGMKKQGRQPLWLQRLKSTQLLDSLKTEEGFRESAHPLIRETKRECLEELWDIEGVLEILNGIQSGVIAVREVYTDLPSPMSLPLQWQAEAAEMYSYSPTTDGIRQAVYGDLEIAGQLKPGAEELQKQQERKKYPENAEQLHSLMMIEGDLLGEELSELNSRIGSLRKGSLTGTDQQASGHLVREWIEELAGRGLVTYVEPGLWIAAEHQEEYEKALINGEAGSLMGMVRRLLYYRGAMSAVQIGERYFLTETIVRDVLKGLQEAGSILEEEGMYYHERLYSRARKATIRRLRSQTATQPGEAYAAMMADLAERNASSEEQLESAVKQYCGQPFPAAFWERVLFPRRVKGYRENMLDQLLAKGEYFWRFHAGGHLCFERYEEIDWEKQIKVPEPERGGQGPEKELSSEELLLYREFHKRGASFMRAFQSLPLEGNLQEILLSLAEKGYLSADSFLSVRQWMNWEKMKKSSPRARVHARVTALSAGRWDIVRPLREKTMEEWLEQLFGQHVILCRETYRRPEGEAWDRGWSKALETLRIWEYTGRVRRGYYVAGMSGAQFVRAQDYESIVLLLKRYGEQASGKEGNIVWLNAADPCQVWGKALGGGPSFMNVQGTLVALRGGIPAAVLERQGKVLRLFQEESGLREETITAMMKELVSLYKQKKLFPEKRRLVIKEYPMEAAAALKAAGFQKEMLDYVIYC